MQPQARCLTFFIYFNFSAKLLIEVCIIFPVLSANRVSHAKSSKPHRVAPICIQRLLNNIKQYVSLKGFALKLWESTYFQSFNPSFDRIWSRIMITSIWFHYFMSETKKISTELPITQGAFKTKAAEGMSKSREFIILIVNFICCSVYKFDGPLSFHLYCI